MFKFMLIRVNTQLNRRDTGDIRQDNEQVLDPLDTGNFGDLIDRMFLRHYISGLLHHRWERSSKLGFFTVSLTRKSLFSEQQIIFGVCNFIGLFFTFHNPVTKGMLHMMACKIGPQKNIFHFEFTAAFSVTLQCLASLKKALTNYEKKLNTIHTNSLTAVLEEGFALAELTSQGRMGERPCLIIKFLKSFLVLFFRLHFN